MSQTIAEMFAERMAETNAETDATVDKLDGMVDELASLPADELALALAGLAKATADKQSAAVGLEIGRALMRVAMTLI